MKKILKKIIAERKRQDKLWGTQNHDDEFWNTIMVEEVGECAQCVVKSRIPPIIKKEAEEYQKNLDIELVQTAAVIIAWLESRERKKKKKKK